MKDKEAVPQLIRHVVRRLDEFVHEQPAENFSNIDEMELAFCWFLHNKDSGYRRPLGLPLRKSDE